MGNRRVSSARSGPLKDSIEEAGLEAGDPVGGCSEKPGPEGRGLDPVLVMKRGVGKRRCLCELWRG